MKERASPGRGRENENSSWRARLGTRPAETRVSGCVGAWEREWMDGWMDLRSDKQSGTTR